MMNSLRLVRGLAFGAAALLLADAGLGASPRSEASAMQQAAVSEGATLEGIYVLTLPECLRAAYQAFRDLRILVVQEETRSTWTALEGRRMGAVPVQIRGDLLSEMRVRVVFTVGTQENPENRAFVRLLKAAFEESLPLTRSRGD